MKAGNLDRTITLQQASRAQNSAGEMDESWADFAEIPAEVTYIRGAEPEAAGLQAGQQQARFRIRHLDGITMDTRINFEGFYWDITEIRPFGRRQGIDLIALAVRD